MSRGQGFPASPRECYVAALRGWEDSVARDKSYRHRSRQPDQSRRPSPPAKRPSIPGRPQFRDSASQVGPGPAVGARADQKAAPTTQAARPPHPGVPARRDGTPDHRADFRRDWGRADRSSSRRGEHLRLLTGLVSFGSLQDGSLVRKEPADGPASPGTTSSATCLSTQPGPLFILGELAGPLVPDATEVRKKAVYAEAALGAPSLIRRGVVAHAGRGVSAESRRNRNAAGRRSVLSAGRKRQKAQAARDGGGDRRRGAD